MTREEDDDRRKTCRRGRAVESMLGARRVPETREDLARSSALPPRRRGQTIAAASPGDILPSSLHCLPPPPLSSLLPPSFLQATRVSCRVDTSTSSIFNEELSGSQSPLRRRRRRDETAEGARGRSACRPRCDPLGSPSSRFPLWQLSFRRRARKP